MLDLGSQTSTNDVGLALTGLRLQLAALPDRDDWRSLIIAAGAMPNPLPQGADMHVVPRHDWALYQQLVMTTPPLRIPTFGDYAIANPDPGLDIDPRLMSLSAQLRYATHPAWLVPKGGLFKGPSGTSQGGAAMQPVAADLQTHPQYMGAQHCGCETWLSGVASGGSGGNPTTWRRYGTLHHIVVVVGQV